MYAQNTYAAKGDTKSACSICPTLLFFVIIAGMSILGLGALRFYSFRLECEVAQINDKIARYEKDISRYEQRMATLKSPSRVHSFASANLGMHGTSHISTVTVVIHSDPENNNHFDLASVKQNNDFFDMLNFFSRRANAKD